MYQTQPKYKQKNTLFIVSTSTGKERDSETGFSYFGARYYDSDILTGWLSVDPMADKYPSLSPYNYCNWNPVKIIDPNGEFGILAHTKMTYKATKKSAKGKIGFFKRISLSYGAGFHADVFGYTNSAIHLDNLNDPNTIIDMYKNAKENFKDKLEKNTVSAGVELHTIADFYAHSNYIELCSTVFEEDKIPTLSEALKNEKIRNILEKHLRTGNYPNKDNDSYSHEKMNKDNNRSEMGEKRYKNGEKTFHEIAIELAKKEISNMMEEIK